MDDIDFEWALSTPPNCYLDFTDGDLCNNGDIQTLWSHEQGSSAAAIEPTEIDGNRHGTVNSEVAPELTKRKRQRVSEVWKSFHIVDEDDGTQSANCNHCPKKYKGYSSKKGTSNLLQHMKKCTAMRNGYGDKPAGGPQVTPVRNREETLCDQQLSNKSIARSMHINHEYPRCMLCNNLRSNTLELQSHKSLKATILVTCTEETEKLVRVLNKSSSPLFDVRMDLRSGPGIFRCCLTLHFICEGWEQKKILHFRKVSVKFETQEDLKVRQSMLQDRSDIDKYESSHEISKEIINWSGYDLNHSLLRLFIKCCQIFCFVHFLHVLYEDGVQEVVLTYLKTMSSLYCVRDATPEKEENFGKTVDQLRSKGKKVTSQYMPTTLIFDVPTLGRMLGLREVFSELLPIDSDYGNYPITEEEWDKANFIYEYLKVLSNAIASLSASTRPTMNTYFLDACKIYTDLQCLWDKITNSDVQSMAHRMKVKFKKFWDVSIESLAIAAILDPRFKLDFVEHFCKKINDQDAEGDCKRIRDFLAEIYNRYAAGILDPYDMLDSLGMPCTSSGDGKSQKSELERYLEEPKYRPVKEFDILGWWRVNTLNFPTLAKMAHDFLPIPMSAAQLYPLLNNQFLEEYRTWLRLESKSKGAGLADLEIQRLEQRLAKAMNQM